MHQHEHEHQTEYEHAIVHYGEIGTKSGNRRFFERTLARNVALSVRPWGRVEVRRQTGRLVFSLSTIPPERRQVALERVATLPGVTSVAAACPARPTLESLCEVAVGLASRHQGSFKIHARRQEKNLPFDSRDVNVAVGAAVQQATGRPVDVHDPDVEYRIDIDTKRAFVQDARLPGPAGLPVGVSGDVISLLSGGIDSPVASYMMMLRGCRVIALHLWNQSFSGEGVREKVTDLARVLAGPQLGMDLHLVPFEAIQQEIVAGAPADLRMLLYRRAMLRVADGLRRETGALATVTGDSVGQVASQTLQNLAAVYEAATPPVLTPLSGTDKNRTVDLARRIGTFEISIRPGEDCCGLLVARHPETAASVEMLRECERHYDLEALAADALAGRETVRLD